MSIRAPPQTGQAGLHSDAVEFSVEIGGMVFGFESFIVLGSVSLFPRSRWGGGGWVGVIQRPLIFEGARNGWIV